MTDINKLFKPSEWQRRFNNSIEVLNNHVTLTQNLTYAARNDIGVKRVKYGHGPNDVYDIYGDENLPKDAPIFVYVHGGYWQEKLINANASGYSVPSLYNAGYRCIILEYELCPVVSLAELIDRIKVGTLSIMKYAKEMNAKFISFAGHSAGAHIVICLYNFLMSADIRVVTANINTRNIKSLYLISGIYDLTEMRLTNSVNPDDILKINSNNDYEKLSVICFDFTKWSNLVKIFIYSAEHESPEFIRQGQELHRRFAGRSKLIELAGLDHFNIVEKLNDPEYDITKQIINDLND